MADVQIPDLAVATEVNSEDEFILRQGGEDKRLSFDKISNHFIPALSGSYLSPVEYDAGISFSINDNMKTISRPDDSTPTDSIQYAPFPESLPFTTTGDWSADSGKFYVVQGVNFSYLASSNLLTNNIFYVDDFLNSSIEFDVDKFLFIAERGCNFIVSNSTSIDNGMDILVNYNTGQTATLVNDNWFVYPEWYGDCSNEVDCGHLINRAKETKKIVILDPDRVYATSVEIAIKNNQRIRGSVRSYLDENNASTIKWIGSQTPDVAVVYMAQNDDRMSENMSSVAYAELSNVLIDGNNIADICFYSNYTSSGTVIKDVYSKNSLKVANLITKCFYTQVDWITARGNQGAGNVFGQYDQSGLMYSGGDAAVNGLGRVNVEGHSNGLNLEWNPFTNSATGFGLGLFGTINKCLFSVTLEANEGSALHENVENGVFDVYGYIESSAKNVPSGAFSGEYSVNLLGSSSVFDKCSIDIQLRTNQNINIRTDGGNNRFYFLKIDGGDNGTGFNLNEHKLVRVSPESRFNYISDIPSYALIDRVVSSGTVNLNSSSSFYESFYIKPELQTLCVLRIIPKSNISDVNNFNVRVDVDGSVITTKGVNLDNKSAYDVIETNLVDSSGLIEIQGTQSIGTAITAHYEVILREVSNSVYQ